MKPSGAGLWFVGRFLNLFIYFWLHCVFVAACTLSLVAVNRGTTLRCGVQASHCDGFFCCRAQALGAQASVAVARGL